MLKRWIYMGCALCIMVVIFVFSGQGKTITYKQSSIVKRQIESMVNKKSIFSKGADGDNNKRIKIDEDKVRKAAHIFLYGILAIFVYLYFESYNLGVWRSFILTLLICFLYGLSDEWHQSFIDGRGGKISDVFIDLIGVNLALGIGYIYKQISKIRKNKPIGEFKINQ